MKKRIKDAIEMLDDRLADLESIFECSESEPMADPESIVMDNTPNDLILLIEAAQKNMMDMRDEMEFLFSKMGDEDFVEDYNDNESSLCERCNRRLSRKERNR